jgi:serine/threonine protein kinase
MKPLAERLSDRKLISHGDISSAYRARDTRLDRDVFLKILHPHFAQDPDLRTRFEREALAAAKLDHPQLVRIYEVGDDPNEGPFMILEWVEGETLAAKIKREGKLAPERVEKLARALLNALSVLHSNGILHRDVKPDNILCRHDGEFKLTDFSLALLSDAPKLTHHSAVVGTPAYLAPELARGKSPSERSDLFAVGVVLFESTTGHNPFYADALLESLRRVREVEPDWKDLEILGTESSLAALIKLCLEKEADARPESAELAAHLLSGEARATFAKKSSGISRMVAALAAVVLMGIGIVAYLSSTNVPEQKQTQIIPSSIDNKTLQIDTTATITAEQKDSTTDVAENTTATNPQSIITETKLRDSIRKPARGQEPEQKIASADSFVLNLDTTPWAHVTLEGQDLGTTPLGAPLRLKGGQHVFMLRNPAFPPIQAQVTLKEDTRVDFQLAEFVQHIELTVTPWGEIYLDNELVGTSPLEKPLTVLPGNHTLRLTHPSLPAVEKSWQAVAGDTIKFSADLNKSVLALRTLGDSN